MIRRALTARLQATGNFARDFRFLAAINGLAAAKVRPPNKNIDVALFCSDSFLTKSPVTTLERQEKRTAESKSRLSL
jgi:hypothetical protein